MFDISDIDSIVQQAAKKPQDVAIDATINLTDTDSDSTESIESADPVFALSHISSPLDVIALGSSSFTPIELESYSDFYTDKRPNLLRNNQPYKETGGIARYCMPKHSPDNRCGWYLVIGDKMTAITDDPELDEAYGPEFYGNVVPNTPGGDGFADDDLLEINANLIRGLASTYLFEIRDELEVQWNINNVFTLSYNRNGSPNTRRIVVLGEDGSISTHGVDRTATELLKPKDLFPVVDSWARVNKVQFDTYRSRITIGDKPVSEKLMPKLVSKVCHEMDVNFKLHEFTAVLQGIAVENEFNSLMERYNKLETLADMNLLMPHSHCTIATEFLKIQDPEHRRYADAVLQHMLEKMVIRAMYPGFPHRSTPILSGPQNGGKSGILRALCGDEHFCEIGTLSSGAKDSGGMAHPDTLKKLTQHNLIVINEIGRVFNNKDISDDELKDLITGERASYIDKYRTEVTSRGRTSVIVGTTNNPYILTDLTGNSRYQIILCGVSQDDPVDWNRLEKVQKGILLSALQAVRALAKDGIAALKGHQLPDWVMAYSDKQNLDFLSGSEFIGLLSPLVAPTIGTTTGQRSTVSMSEIAVELGLKSSEIKSNRAEICRAMKYHGYSEWGKKIRFNGSNAQTVFVREGLSKPKSRETSADCLPAGDF